MLYAIIKADNEVLGVYMTRKYAERAFNKWIGDHRAIIPVR